MLLVENVNPARRLKRTVELFGFMLGEVVTIVFDLTRSFCHLSSLKFQECVDTVGALLRVAKLFCSKWRVARYSHVHVEMVNRQRTLEVS